MSALDEAVEGFVAGIVRGLKDIGFGCAGCLALIAVLVLVAGAASFVMRLLPGSGQGWS